MPFEYTEEDHAKWWNLDPGRAQFGPDTVQYKRGYAACKLAMERFYAEAPTLVKWDKNLIKACDHDGVEES